ncbi:Hint domain-containing protein [Sulfitobacter donghicola]|uniref:Hemolysin-type calcium-binding protein n=1 Tax=Sulfitobacter donghicola DSW-25 = KCTC 12864 = JCM 14565 TaxID=1300350 RepID=A0A073IJL7_9RHOB|nr:Hint domain-containing protein [Sulfitobacter donghicola]KEJ89721.1 hemolysin-type calcium-binding protein [Sulfitobacter donghicola DSW-25 = KCTC 12864 = JCM 14565]KIN67184.1 Hemolysin-type calcium-binding protein [Sulfitobacter donghicola DSW-25 = KCTC 12864 = JCM 14565]
MGTGFRGTFVISWSQTEIDGLEAAPVQALSVGAAWAWRGDAVRVDGPSDVLRLDEADGAEELRKRAARMVHRLVGAAFEHEPGSRSINVVDENSPLMDNSFVVTDGGKSYSVTLIEVGGGSQPLLMFMNEMPPRNCDLWIVHHTLGTIGTTEATPQEAGVICFTPGTRIRTGDGTTLIEDLREGDLVQTKDNGLQPLRWIGKRRMSGARLFAMPRLRPIRISGGAFGFDRPDEDLLVSPEHRMLIKGAQAQSLFNTSEVLVTAKDLINGSTITVDMQLREVTYIHVLLEQHQVLWANELETESFHPASAAFSTLDQNDRQRLLAEMPELEYDPHTYGSYARRTLSASEAAILKHAA